VVAVAAVRPDTGRPVVHPVVADQQAVGPPHRHRALVAAVRPDLPDRDRKARRRGRLDQDLADRGKDPAGPVGRADRVKDLGRGPDKDPANRADPADRAKDPAGPVGRADRVKDPAGLVGRADRVKDRVRDLDRDLAVRLDPVVRLHLPVRVVRPGQVARRRDHRRRRSRLTVRTAPATGSSADRGMHRGASARTIMVRRLRRRREGSAGTTDRHPAARRPTGTGHHPPVAGTARPLRVAGITPTTARPVTSA
jgi:hypothetical protein